MVAIHSRLYKAAMLGTESSFFPLMVQAAAWGTGTPYSPELLHKCAADFALLKLLDLKEEGGMDAVITEQISTAEGGGELDTAINAAVLRYKPSTSEPAE